jgi:hypothetical protein
MVVQWMAGSRMVDGSNVGLVVRTWGWRRGEMD